MSQIIKHHLPDNILLAYAAGSLPEAFNLIVASHISLCDSCRAHAESLDAVGGSLLENTCPVVEMDTDGLAATLAMIEAFDASATDDAPKIDEVAQETDVLPSPLRDYVGGDLDAIKWRPIGMGVKQAVLKTSSDATARLLFIPAGAAMPDHGHNGMEMTLVLQGAFMDDDDYFAKGDLEYADSDLHHMPVADIHEDCICLAVTDAPLQFKGIIPRIAQRFIGI